MNMQYFLTLYIWSINYIRYNLLKYSKLIKDIKI